MLRDLAVLKGRTSIYSELDDGKVLILKDNYQYTTVSKENFEILFYKLTESITALKEDCIEYVVYYPYSPLLAYPRWYIDAHFDGELYEDAFGTSIFVDRSGELLMSPGSIVLRNYRGDLRYMERDEFEKYYETPGGFNDEC